MPCVSSGECAECTNSDMCGSCQTSCQYCNVCDKCNECQSSCTRECNSCNSCQGCNSCNSCNSCQGGCNSCNSCNAYGERECNQNRQTPAKSGFFTFPTINYNTYTQMLYDNHYKSIFDQVSTIKEYYKQYKGTKPFADWSYPDVQVQATTIKAKYLNDIISNTTNNGDKIIPNTLNTLWNNIKNYQYNENLCASCNTQCNNCNNSCQGGCNNCNSCNKCQGCNGCNSCNGPCNVTYNGGWCQVCNGTVNTA